MTTVLETERVRLREFIPSDLDVVAAMMADKDQMTLYPRPRTREEPRAWIDRNLVLYESRGFGFWLMESPERSTFLGYSGIRPRSIEGVEEVEMGWHTVKSVWNQGFATEAAAACRDLAFSRFDIPRLVATIDHDNPPSIRIATKIGMQVEREAVLEGWNCVIYAINRSAFKV